MWFHMKPSASHGGERPWAKGENLGCKEEEEAASCGGECLRISVSPAK